MKFHTEYLTFQTAKRREYINITPRVEEAVDQIGRLRAGRREARAGAHAFPWLDRLRWTPALLADRRRREGDRAEGAHLAAGHHEPLAAQAAALHLDDRRILSGGRRASDAEEG